MEMSPDKSLLVTCGDAVVVAVVHNDAVAGDVAAADDVVVVVGAMVVVWVQQCLMRPCTSPQFHFVLVVVTLMGKEPSWWYQKITQGPHSTMGRLVCFQP